MTSHAIWFLTFEANPYGIDRVEGRAIVELMREHGVTIRGLAARMSVTMERVRCVRAEGLLDGSLLLDWYHGIVGSLDGFWYWRHVEKDAYRSAILAS